MKYLVTVAIILFMIFLILCTTLFFDKPIVNDKLSLPRQEQIGAPFD